MKFSIIKIYVLISTVIIFCASAVPTPSYAQERANDNVTNNIFSLESLKSFFWPSLGSSSSSQKQNSSLNASGSNEKSGSIRICENDDCSPPPRHPRGCEPGGEICNCGKRCGNGEGNA